jgi:hypothetical protein
MTPPVAGVVESVTGVMGKATPGDEGIFSEVAMLRVAGPRMSKKKVER